jgi:tetratricopeptide (TPR) repeat protein
MNEHPSYAQLTADIVRQAGEPLTLDDIQAQVEEVRTITSRNPRQTVRAAMRQEPFIETLGGRPARYTWWPRHLVGSSFRQSLVDADLETGVLNLSDELWTIFGTDFGGEKRRVRGPAGTRLELAVEADGSVHSRIRGAHLILIRELVQGVGSATLADWFQERGAKREDDLIVRVLDLEERRFAVDLQRRGQETIEASVSERNQTLVEMAYRIARAGGPSVISFEMFHRLIAHDVYAHSLPPEPWPLVLRADLRFVVDRYVVNLAGRLVDDVEQDRGGSTDPLAYPRPRGRRDQARSERVRQAWGRYLFDRGMEWRWAGHDREAVAYYKETLRLDPGHADAWVHVGNVRFEEGYVRQALSLYERGEAAALERMIGDPGQYVGPFWGDVDSRPYMRALHGQGLCYYRLGRLEEASRAFKRMLELNPNDNQGARFLLRDMEDGLTWEQRVEKENESIQTEER